MLPTFVVIEAEPIIRQDLAEILATCTDGALVVDFATAAEALAWFDQAPAADLVFIGYLLDAANRDRLLNLVTARGAIPVYVGSTPKVGEAEGRAMMLDVPFTNSSVPALVQQWQQWQQRGTIGA